VPVYISAFRKIVHTKLKLGGARGSISSSTSQQRNFQILAPGSNAAVTLPGNQSSHDAAREALIISSPTATDPEESLSSTLLA